MINVSANRKNRETKMVDREKTGQLIGFTDVLPMVGWPLEKTCIQLYKKVVKYNCS